jgi:hypothetical protein
MNVRALIGVLIVALLVLTVDALAVAALVWVL